MPRCAMQLDVLKSNYRSVLDRAGAAAGRAGREEASWRLVAVTKSVGAEVAAALADLGAADLAENRVQDLLEKQAALAGEPVNWHLIGHLQTNKVKKIVGEVSLIHGVDSLRLAEAIESVGQERGVEQDVLLEVNIAGEESKFGLGPDEAADVAVSLAAFSSVRVVGLMTMAPIVDDAEKTRPVFRGLKALAEEIAGLGGFARERYELSMGMTQDFEIAIEEGATLIRVGSALFKGI
jgi:PLP dependent protein